MNSRVRIGMRVGLGLTMGLVLSTATASADIYTFWKTGDCPADPRPGSNPPRKLVTGKMSTPYTADAVPAVNFASVGGVFCYDETQTVSFDATSKPFLVPNANIGETDPNMPRAFPCAVCMYDPYVHIKGMQGIPTLSTAGVIVLAAGIVTTWFYQRRKELQEKAA